MQIKFMDLDRFARNLDPVTSPQYFTKTGDFHPEGLFSEAIFGPVGTKERREVYSYIDLGSYIVHPTALKILSDLDRRINDFISTKQTFSIDSNGNMIADPKGITGITEFMKVFDQIKFRGGTPNREKYIEVLTDAHKRGILFINKIPVIPPDFRNAYQNDKGDWMIDPLNNFYVSILRRSLQAKSSGGGPLRELLLYGLQTSTLDYDNFVRTKVSKKSGIIRSQLMGKRVDFSGRAVITPNPSLKVNEVGVPIRIAVSIFEPFILFQIFRTTLINRDELSNEIKNYTKQEFSVDSVQRVLKSIKAGDEIPDKLLDLIFIATEAAMKGRVVLCKRDPVLHPESYRAFTPILIKGNTLQICTFQVGGFNADFDGDQMAIYHPLTNQAQQEAKTKMTRGQVATSTKDLAYNLSNEMFAGLYLMTRDVKSTRPAVAISKSDIESANDPYLPVMFKGKKTTMGKAVFNSCFPPDFPFVDKNVTKSIINKEIIPAIFKKYGDEVTQEVVSNLGKVGFKFSTIMAPSITLDQLKIPDEIYELKKKLVGATPDEANMIIKQMEKILVQHLKDKGLYYLIESGAGKGWGQPLQILAAKGIVADPKGKILDPIPGSYTEGLKNDEFFNASYGSRKGIIDRVINTADTGYLSRKLAYLLNNVEADLYLRDCKTTKTLTTKLTKNLISRLDGRFIVRNGKLEEFDQNNFKVGDVIDLRSPIFCKSPKICHTCYGRLLEWHRSPQIGMLAAQTIGERGTQLIMKTFHTGGAVELERKDALNDIAENEISLNLATVKKYLTQINNVVACNKSCTVNIDLANYKKGDSIEITDETISVKSLICNIIFDDFNFTIILDYPIDIFIYEEMEKKGNIIQLKFNKDARLFELPVEGMQKAVQVNYVERLIGGKEVFRDAEHLFKKLFNIYAPVSSADSVHVEVLLSNCLRFKDNPAIPARLGPRWDPVLLNIKTIIFSSSLSQGLAFENINKAISTGLITEQIFEPSILERVLSGELTSKRKR